MRGKEQKSITKPDTNHIKKKILRIVPSILWSLRMSLCTMIVEVFRVEVIDGLVDVFSHIGADEGDRLG